MIGKKGTFVAVIGAVAIFGAAFAAGSTLGTAPKTVAAAPSLYNQGTVTSIYSTSKPAIVEIQTVQNSGGTFGGGITEGQGSGFLIDNQGHILTNNHVVKGATSVKVVLNSGKTIDAKVLGTDATHDLAVIGVNPADMAGITPLQFGDSATLQPGQMAIAIGSPEGLYDSVSLGIISGLNRTISNEVEPMIQTDAALNPGNSGGPLLNADGKVVGINTAVETTTGTGGLGFAIPSDLASSELSSLISGKQYQRPWLGISGMSLTPTTANSLGIKTDQGVYVASVVASSPAAKAGLKGATTTASGNPGNDGDIITAVDGTPMTTSQGLAAYLGTKQPGDTVTLTVLRGGKTLSLTVTLGTWPAQTPTQSQAPNNNTMPSFPQMPSFPGNFPWGR